MYGCTSWTQKILKNVRWKLLKNSTCCLEQILERISCMAIYLPSHKRFKLDEYMRNIAGEVGRTH